MQKFDTKKNAFQKQSKVLIDRKMNVETKKTMLCSFYLLHRMGYIAVSTQGKKSRKMRALLTNVLNNIDRVCEKGGSFKESSKCKVTADINKKKKQLICWGYDVMRKEKGRGI